MYVFIYLCMYVPVIIMNLIADVIRYHKAVLQPINVCMYVRMYVCPRAPSGALCSTEQPVQAFQLFLDVSVCCVQQIVRTQPLNPRSIESSQCDVTNVPATAQRRHTERKKAVHNTHRIFRRGDRAAGPAGFCPAGRLASPQEFTLPLTTSSTASVLIRCSLPSLLNDTTSTAQITQRPITE